MRCRIRSIVEPPEKEALQPYMLTHNEKGVFVVYCMES